jgi:hypothetical protein
MIQRFNLLYLSCLIFVFGLHSRYTVQVSFYPKASDVGEAHGLVPGRVVLCKFLIFVMRAAFHRPSHIPWFGFNCNTSL